MFNFFTFSVEDLIWALMKRPPDFVIGGKDNPYLLRWWVIPRNKFFNIYLHWFLRSDDDRAAHDHPWWNLSIVLTEGYTEWVPINGDYLNLGAIHRMPGQMVLRKPESAHRIELYKYTDGTEIPAWTLFITGPRIRE